MKKITLLLLFLFLSVSGYSQLATEGFENTSGPSGPLPAVWTLGTGDWAVFERNNPTTVGTGQSWGINAFATGLQCQGQQIASVSREQIGAGGTSEDFLATPAISIPASGVTELHFWTRTFVAGNQNTIFKVMIAPAIPGQQADPSIYTLLQQWSELDLIIPTTNFNICTEKTVTIPDFLNGQEIYIAFVREYTQPDATIDGDRWLIDNVAVDVQCTAPVPGTTTLITQNNAVLNWTGPAGVTQWEIEVALAADAFNGVVDYTATGPSPASFTIPPGDLLSNTAYKYRVRGICSSGFTSAWSAASANFTTNIAPPVCGGNLVDSGGPGGNYSNNENLTTTVCPAANEVVTVTFTAFNTQANTDFLKIYDGNDVTAPLLANLSGTTLPPTFTSTAATGCLTFNFTSNGTTVAAGYTANITCGPAPACRIPAAVTASATTTTSTVLNWTQPANPDTSVATMWDIIALPASSAPPTAGSVPNFNGNDVTGAGIPPFTLTGLTPATCYDIYVRAVCGTTNSAWSTVPVNVCTLVAPPECGGNFVDSGGTAGNYANNANATTVICPTVPGGGDAVTVTFTQFNTQAGNDILRVYDGDNATATLLASLSGTALPPSFTSTAPSGCLTFVFTSNATTTAAGWLANVICAPQPTCAAPTVLANSTTTHNTTTISWTQPANPDGSSSGLFDIFYQPCNQPAPNASTNPQFNDVAPTGGTAPNFTFLVTGLSPLTCYDIYIRSACGSTWSGPTVTTTLAAPPECGGNFVDAGGTTGAYAANSNITTIICPATPGDVVTVTFTAFNTEATFDALYVYNGNAVVPANLIPSGNGAGNVPGGIAGGYWGTTVPCQFTSASANGCLTFVFRSDASVQNPGWLANITCGPPPTCRIPSTLTASSVTHNSAVLNWTQAANADGSTASMWDIFYQPCGQTPPTAATPPTLNDVTGAGIPPFPLTGLTPATCYDVYIRAVCGPTDSSAWICVPATFTTLVAPPECGGNFVDAGGATGNYANNSNVTTIICPNNPGEIVTVTFTQFFTEANWDGLYVYDGSGVVPANQIPSANGPGTVPGGIPGSFWGNLTGDALPGPFTSTNPDGCLTFVFRSDASVNNPGWLANITCAPAPTCARPVLLNATGVTQTSAQLNWSQLANPNGTTASQWEVIVLPAGQPAPPAGFVVNTTSYLAAPLAPGTAYVFYVRAVCGPGDVSTWSALNFATLPTNDECANATFAIVNQNLNCVQTTHGTLAGATASAPPTTCGGAGAANDDVWFTFTATTVTHVISFNNVTPATAMSYAIYQGTCNGLTEVGCDTGAGLVAGQTYYIRVFSDSTQPQFTEFDLCIGTLPCTEAPAFCTGQTVTYANSTNVPSLGQIGCLFTSPNPAFFFLQVNQAGPLSYLISQVDNNGVGRDVDYVAWGPFTDLNTACTGVPANPLGQTVPIPTPATGCPGTLHACSYSTAPQEIMCIPNAQLCQVYVIMITNFSNQAGTVTFTQTNTGGGTTACFPINTFNYSQTYYCQNQPNPTPVLAPGASAGVYTSTPGLVIDSATGTIDLAASTPGAYVVTSTSETTIGGTCTSIPFITTTRTVIITAPAAATIAYAAPTYCNSLSITEPVIRTGTSGGTYSATPAGLLINAINGDIVPVASAPGVYTVTYSIAATGGCPVFTTTTQVEILAAPVINQANVTACDTFTLPALAVGNYFSQTGGVGTPLDIAVPITATQPVFIYAQAANGCITERQFTVTINSVPTPTFTVTQSSCTTPTGSITVTSPVSPGGTLPANLFISEVTDADTGSLTYVELYNATGASVDLSGYKLKFYTWGAPPTAENLQCDLQLAGTILNNSTNVIKVSNSANAAGVAPNQTFASCAGVNNNDNIRLTTSAGVEVDVWGRVDGSIFTPGGNTGYTYRRLTTATVPSATWVPSDWTPIDPEDYSNVGQYTGFVVSNYQYSIDNGTTFQSNPLFSNVAPGPHLLVVRDITTGCLSEPIQVVIDAVNAIPSVTTFTYTTPICQNSTTNPLPDTSATGFTSGGTFTSNPSTGIDLNATTGEINLANTTAGSYDITYTIPFDPVTCQSFGSTTFTVVITNVITPVTGFTYTTPICQDAQATLSPTLAGGFTTGGVFSSTTGLSIDGTTGDINLATSTAGSYTVTYTLAGTSCLAATVSTFDIVINPVITPVTTFTYTTPICQNATTNPLPDTSATGFTSGGTFTSNPSTGIDLNATTGEINLVNTTAGTYDITYTVAANAATCQVLSTTTFTVVITNVITPVTGFTYTTPICQNAQATLSPTLAGGFTTGGVFSSTTGLSIDGTTGDINLATSTAGSYTVTYTLTGTSCLAATVSTFDIVISPVITPVTGFTYATPVCQSSTTNPMPQTAGGFTAGGTFTSNPSTGIDLNATTGEINLVNTTAGTYDITYTVAANAATCQVVSTTTFTVVITNIIAPVVGFSYTTPICKNAQATLSPTLAAGFTLGGTFSSTAGLTINASTGVIDLANSTAGAYTITYAVTANTATCQGADSSTFNIVINPVITPVTVFSYDSPFCSALTSTMESPNLGAGFTTGGTFSSSNGLTLNSVTGEIDLASTPGTYTVTYSVNADPATCQVASSSTAQVTINNPITIELNGGCQDVYVLNATGSFDPQSATFSWQNAAGVEVGTGQSLNVPVAGNYTVIVTVGGCSTESAPFEVLTIACRIQRGISVNNDGFNDTFDLTGFDVKKLTIYNRYGMEVYSRANYVNEWGGKSDDGDELPDGTYFYVLDKNTGDSITGWVYINRAQ
ncbi:fibronectin type III domain-containing protein [Flavobacterium sp.]